MPEKRSASRQRSTRVEPRLQGGPAAPAVRRRDVYTEADGLFGRLTDLVIENPLRSGGFVMVAMVIGAIVTNAAYFQTAHHPAPFFQTRPAPADAPAAGAEASPAQPPKDRVGAMIASPPATAEPPADPASLVEETQRALVALKLYSGPIDGKSGPQTRAAVSAFETSQGLPVTGQPSAKLLILLKRAAQKTADVAPNPAPALTASPMPPATTAAAPVPPAPIPGVAESVAADPTETGSIASDANAGDIRHVQVALNTIGYGPIRIDGKGGPGLADAVRRFETDNNLAVTGTVNAALIAKLVAIGAMKAH